MSPLPIIRKNPHLIEINAFTFLSAMSRKYREKLTLMDIPEGEWQSLADKGFNLVWLMGVWRRSPYARQQALKNMNLRQAYDCTLPGWKDEDVAGSPYAIYDYSLDPFLGEKSELKRLKDRLNNLGLGLVLDFVPNHLALDHPWTLTHSRRFINGTKRSLLKHPDWFFTTSDGKSLAYGRDPNFPSWIDTVQVNFYSAEMRQALTEEMLKIAAVSDGLRCDMAMLGLNSVFEKVWGKVYVTRVKPETEFWADAISAVKARYPPSIFLAEVYWNLDKELRQLGFDYTYDKVLYDRLKYDNAEQVRQYLVETPELDRMAHYIENHDEPPAIANFGERSGAAAVTIATIPGMRFFYMGQVQGKCLHAPVQLAREPEEPANEEIAEFYYRLLESTDSPVWHQSSWQCLETTAAWEENESHKNLMCWCWQYEDVFKLVAVNYSAVESQGRVRLPPGLEGKNIVSCYDELANATYESRAEEVAKLGLYIALKPWQSHILNIQVI